MEKSENRFIDYSTEKHKSGNKFLKRKNILRANIPLISGFYINL